MARRIPVKPIIERRARGDSQRCIAKSLGVARQSVAETYAAADELGLGWGDVEGMSDAEAYALLFPGKHADEAVYPDPDWARVHRELARVGVTLKLLHEEYAAGEAEAGRPHMSYDRFCKRYGDWVTEHDLTSRVEHKAGQVAEVDWSGPTIQLFDAVTGEPSGKAYLFVGTLPFSQYTYAEATEDMAERSWLMCHVHMYEFFGGSPAVTRPDNCKTAVVAHPRDGEVVLNGAYREMAAHYMCAVVPARVRRPKDKPSAEGSVGKLATAIIARLRDRRFHNTGELNLAIRHELALFNAAPFQKREGSRAEVFEAEEGPELRPLPAVPYEVCEWVRGRKVAPNSHVQYRRNFYSVSWRYVGRTVDLRVTEHAVEVWCQGERLATHPLFASYERNRYSTREADMPPGSGWREWDRPRIEAWAKRVGPSMQECVARVFSRCDFAEQGFNPALALLRLTRKYPAERVERACGMALAAGKPSPRYRDVEPILRSGQDKGGPG